MPFYDYFCPDNGKTVEVKHEMNKKIATWGELCKLADIPLGKTASKAKVQKIISAPLIQTPTSNSKLKELGFTKLVKRDKGVYENVTATDKESRIVKTDNPSTFPNLKKKIGD